MKIRTGWDDSSINAVEVARLIEDCGGDMVAIHGRTRQQGYSGQANWNIIAAVKQAVSIPVIGCGDITTPEQALARLAETGVDGVMIGRGAIANPWIFRQTSELMRGEPVYQPTLGDQTYGQAEAPQLITYLSTKDLLDAIAGGNTARFASCGRSTLNTRVEIMNDGGELLPAGEKGEIVVSGSLVFGGYFNNPAATAEVSTFGWHHTGDVGYKDEDGFVYIIDRKKDMIISGGFNVFSDEVEQVVLAIPPSRNARWSVCRMRSGAKRSRPSSNLSRVWSWTNRRLLPWCVKSSAASTRPSPWNSGPRFREVQTARS